MTPPALRTTYHVGLDLGQASDPTALVILARPAAQDVAAARLPPVYEVPHLRRWPLGTSYPAIVADVGKLLARPELAGAVLVVDQTGVGRPVVDFFKKELSSPWLVPVTITSGQAVTVADDGRRGPVVGGLVLPGDLAGRGVQGVKVVAAEAAAEEYKAAHDGGRGQGAAAGDGDLPSADGAVLGSERGGRIHPGHFSSKLGVDLHGLTS